ncbi:hypothetical protein OG21DRAFT_1508995 [Imleria badia]|nr:hypothetical protein OG21DRAFT_1508995 [Imleria badia]
MHQMGSCPFFLRPFLYRSPLRARHPPSDGTPQLFQISPFRSSPPPSIRISGVACYQRDRYSGPLPLLGSCSRSRSRSTKLSTELSLPQQKQDRPRDGMQQRYVYAHATPQIRGRCLDTAIIKPGGALWLTFPQGLHAIMRSPFLLPLAIPAMSLALIRLSWDP